MHLSNVRHGVLSRYDPNPSESQSGHNYDQDRCLDSLIALG